MQDDQFDNKDQSIISSSPREYTARAIVVGCLVGCIVTSGNVYLGLKTGWSFGASIMSAILGYALFQMIPNSNYGKLENNISQTAGSAASSMASAAGLLAPIPAMKMLGYDIDGWSLFLWGISTAFLGVMFAVPLRRQYVVVEKLKFPTGLATANTMDALYADGKSGLEKAKWLGITALLAFCFAVVTYFWPKMEWSFWPDLETLPLVEWTGNATIIALSAWGVSLLISPVMFGAGMMIGPRVGFSLLLGAGLGWTLGYFVQQWGWAPHESPMVISKEVEGIKVWGPRGWILWPGVAIMVGESLMSLGLSYKTILGSFTGTKAVFSKSGSDSDEIPNKWWMGGLVAASLVTITIAYFVFEIPPHLSLLAIVVSFLLANVAVRATGETDINPVGGVGKVTQIIFGTVSSSISTNLMAAGITGGGASQAADMMQDFKTGDMVGAKPRNQFKAQMWGILAGICVAVPIYLLFDWSFDIGAEDSPLPAPAALAWKSVAEVMSLGFSALPPFAPSAIIWGLILGGGLAVLKKVVPSVSDYVPSGIALGLAFILPAFYSIIMALGSLAYVIWKRSNPDHCTKYMFAVSCGLLAGEGLGGVCKAILNILGV